MDNDTLAKEILIISIEKLIEEIEGQGLTMITTDTLRTFIHNMKNNIVVEGKIKVDIGK